MYKYLDEYLTKSWLSAKKVIPLQTLRCWNVYEIFSLKHKHWDKLNREVIDDITHNELSFLLETTNNVFYSILMNFEHNFPLSHL